MKLELRSKIFPNGEPTSKGLEALAQPKRRGGVLPFLQVLARQFPYDTALRRMLRQSLDSAFDGRTPWKRQAPSDHEVCDAFQKPETHKMLVNHLWTGVHADSGRKI